MEKATLRPVPLRPPGPVDPGEAAAHVAAALPDLDEQAVRALALVEIAGQPRAEVASAIALAPEALAIALTRARKALRRSIFPLSASGWCERAERMISDRIDGELHAPGPRRLEVHLDNCDRCVEHDRRLAQARDQLVRDFIDAHPHADVAPLTDRVAAGLRVVPPTVVEDVAEEPPVAAGPVAPSFGGPAPDPVLLDAGAGLPAPGFSGPVDGWVPLPVELREPARDDLPEGLADETPEELADDPPLVEREIAPAEPADATPSETDADPASEPPVEAPADPLDERSERVEAPSKMAEARSDRLDDWAEPIEAPAGTAIEAAGPPTKAAASPAATTAAPVPRPLRSPVLLVWSALYGIAVLFAVLTVVLFVLALAGVERVI